MKQLWQLNWDHFIAKIGRWNITSNSLTQVIFEESTTGYVFYLPTPEADYCCAIKKSELKPVDRMNIMDISIPGILINRTPVGSVEKRPDPVIPGIKPMQPVITKPSEGLDKDIIKQFEKQEKDHLAQSVERAKKSGFFK